MTLTLSLPRRTPIADLRWMLSTARRPVVRPLSVWAEQEIILPDGPFKGERFRCRRQPYSRLFFDAIDSRRFNRIAAVGPTQTGKTLLCFVLPVLYHLFELKETVIVGLPNMDMANDKWNEDLLPAIDASPAFRACLPTKGEGSRGGSVKRAVRFMNGATLRFMAAGGRDKQRAGFTGRVLAVTEVDGFDQSSETSREADKIEQLEARTRAFGRTGKQVYLECTASTEKGRIWREYTGGTESQIVVRCPHCAAWVCPGREHLRGWESADSELAAAEQSHFACPACEQPWTEDHRIAANADCRLVHHGQTIAADGSIAGEPRRTDTLGFRWTAFNNLFVTAADLGAEEWTARRDPDEENAEKKMKQFVWALPYEPPEIDLTSLDFETLKRRTADLPRGFCPADSTFITLGIDIGKRLAHYVAMAWTPRTGSIIDYGVLEIPSDDVGVLKGTLLALRDARDRLVQAGYPMEGAEVYMRPSVALIDAGWFESRESVYAFCRESAVELKADVFRPAVGFGAGQQRKTQYVRPTAKSTKIRLIGEDYHLVRIRAEKLVQVECDANHWKSWLHQGLSTPRDRAAAISLFSAPPHEHTKLAKHLTAERQVEKYEPSRGTQVVWETVRRENHFLDAAYLACVGGHIAGFRIEPDRDTTMQALSRDAAVAGGPADRQKWWSRSASSGKPSRRSAA